MNHYSKTVNSGVRLERISVNKRVLVVGGGMAGLETALKLTRLGYEVTLLETAESPGGSILSLSSLYGLSGESDLLVQSRIEAIKQNPAVRVLTGARLVGVTGTVGDFRVEIEQAGQTIENRCGAIVVATGLEFGEELPGTGSPEKTISHKELERRLVDLQQSETNRSRMPSNICLIVEDEGVDSAMFSASALKNALAIKRLSKSSVFVCCDNVNVAGSGLEELYREARSEGVVIFRLEDMRPQVRETRTGLAVTVKDSSAAAPGGWQGLIEIECDLLVLPERATVPADGVSLQHLLNVSCDSDGWFQENNVWAKPVESNRRGIFFAGGCRGNFDVEDILAEAKGAALEVHNLLRHGKRLVPVGRVAVDASKCAVCLTCLRSCPHDAIEILVDDKGHNKAARIIDIACEACGICVAQCPANAIQMLADQFRDQDVAVSV